MLKYIEIKQNIIKNSKIYNVKKAIEVINKIINKEIKNNRIFKTKVIFLLSKTLTPAEVYCYEKVFDNLINLKYQIIYEESLIKDKNEIIIWDNQIVHKDKIYCLDNLETLKSKSYILIGISNNWDEIKNKLEDITNNNIMEYENSNTILFERV